ncbi:MAG: ATP-binding protein [Patescibacteria group bacterium]
MALLSFLEKEYAPSLTKTKQSISFDHKKPFFVNLERNLIMRLAHNVISNFLKYAGEGTTLQMKWFRRSGKVYIIFQDNGHGVKKANIPYLHEKFYQEDASRSGGSARGIGIGLSVVDKIAKIHGGSLQIQSDLDKGFLLRVSFAE